MVIFINGSGVPVKMTGNTAGVDLDVVDVKGRDGMESGRG